MRSIIESFHSALQSIRMHAFRSFLTMLGIVIGVASVITVVSLIQGLSYSINQNFRGLGSNSLTIRSYTSFKEQMQGKVNHLTLNDYRQVVRHLEGIEDVTPSFLPFGPFGTEVRHEHETTFTRVAAVTSSYQDAYQVYPQEGRFISDSDERSHRRVCVIGAKVRESLKLSGDALGKFIEIHGEWFKIVGVTEVRGEMFGLSQDDYVLIPFSTGQSVAGDPAEQDISITFTIRDIEQLEAVQTRVTELLRQLHHLRRGVADDFKVQTARQLSDSFAQIVDTLTLVLGGVVGVSLLVGGIGIMNVMLVTVTERTREIGICKALGAKRHHILMQFLIEATVLALLGGLAGLLLGYLLGATVSELIPGFPRAIVPWWAAMLACGFSAAVGVVFGIMPAAKAANLSPIEALRYE